MDTVKKFYTVLSVVALAVGLSACTGPVGQASNEGPVNGQMTERTITLTDGREVLCLFWDSKSYEGGMSCDWENAR